MSMVLKTIVIQLSLISSLALGQAAKDKPVTTAAPVEEPTTTTPKAAAPAKGAPAKDNDDKTFQTIMSTSYDFDETSINGQMKAPSGFFLQGRQAQSLSQMVKLRSKFDQELRSSRSGVKSAVK